MDSLGIAWSAGFLEGEGSFMNQKVKARSGKEYYYPRVQAAQVELAPLLRLVEIFGGRIYSYKRISYWLVRGEKSIDIMIALYPYMSPKRKRQIEMAWS